METAQECKRVTELVKRLRTHADGLPLNTADMSVRNAAVTMYDAAATLVDHVLDGVEPR